MRTVRLSYPGMRIYPMSEQSSSYRLAGLVCDLDSGEMKLIDAAIARHLDLMHHYNTLVKVIEDKEKHVDALNDILEKLRNITGTVTNQELLEVVEQLIMAKNSS